jgi:hypothetical protein
VCPGKSGADPTRTQGDAPIVVARAPHLGPGLRARKKLAMSSYLKRTHLAPEALVCQLAPNIAQPFEASLTPRFVQNSLNYPERVIDAFSVTPAAAALVRAPQTLCIATIISCSASGPDAGLSACAWNAATAVASRFSTKASRFADVSVGIV